VSISTIADIGNRAFLTNQALPPEVDWGLATMRIVERPQTRLAVMDLVLAV
jgi:hypothetical protein